MYPEFGSHLKKLLKAKHGQLAIFQGIVGGALTLETKPG